MLIRGFCILEEAQYQVLEISQHIKHSNNFQPFHILKTRTLRSKCFVIITVVLFVHDFTYQEFFNTKIFGFMFFFVVNGYKVKTQFLLSA